MSANTKSETTVYPDYVRDEDIHLSKNSLEVLRRRYLRRGKDGQPIETPAQMFYRVAYHLGKAESLWGGDVEEATEVFYHMLTSLRFFPNSPTFTGAGTPLGQLAACFVLPIEDDMGKHPDGIFQTLRNAALIQQTGGGNGFSFSRLRPRGDRVSTSRGIATGPVGFLEAYDRAFGVIAQGGTRRGANMAVLNVDHPDVEEFISAKAEEGKLTNFNISVGITDAFMEAVEKDEDFDLINPRTGEVWRTVNARELFDKIAYYAHKNGEPGLLFLDTANRTNPVPHLYKLEATNPCFVGDTRIPTEFGLLTIAELAEMERGGFIATDNRALPDENAGDHPGVALRLASPAWMTRRQTPVMRLTTKQGYTVTATPDHRFLTPNGYVELQDLKPGDVLLLQSGEGVWSRETKLPQLEGLRVRMAEMAHGGDRASGRTVQRRDFQTQYANLPQRWSHDLGVVLGVLVGDGWLSEHSNSPVGMAFSEPELLSRVHEPMKRWFGEGHVHERSGVTQLTYGRLPYEFFKTLGVSEARAHEKRVPESIWRAPREAVVGFLQGLFSADGSVQVNETKMDCSVRLASSSKALLQDVQVLLSNFGIMARLHQRRAAGERPMPDGRGGVAMYAHHAQYELIIGKANRDRFAETIGFLQREKQDKLLSFIRNKKRASNRETYQDIVLSIEDAGIADVYDLNQPDTHSLIANGLVCHNCGEQWLGPYENCCLGSVNLAQHVTEDGRVDWEKLRETVETATRFLDNVVEVNAYVPAVPQLKEAAHRVRRIGMGIMGLADVMYATGVRYGSEASIDLAGQLMEFVRFHAMRTSIELARERGPFPAIKGSIYDPDDLKWSPPEPLVPYSRDFGRPEIDWNAIVEGIKAHGIRNGAQTTIAPTGTIGTVTGCEGYGCEPVFALAYTRYVKEADGDVALTYVSPSFQKALEEAGIHGEMREQIIEQVMHDGTCQGVKELPEHIRHTFVVSMDITPEEHVIMQAALQRFVDNSISKCVVGDTLMLTEKGLTPIRELSDMRLDDQFEPLDIGVISPQGRERTEAFYYGGYRETRRVTLEYGFGLEATPNHRIHVLDETGRVQFRRLDELRIGDMVVLYAGQHVYGPPAAALPAFSGVYRTNSKRVNFPQRMNEDLAFLLGAITAEGAITQNGVTISNTNFALLEDLQRIVREQFGLEARIVPDGRNDVHNLVVNSRALRHWLLIDLGMEAGAENKRIPTSILQASEAEIAAFLRGLFLDGFMTQDGKLFGITLASETLIRQLQILLLNMDVLATRRQTAKRAWNLTVQGAELDKLAEQISFVEVWKNERLARHAVGRLQRPRNYSRLLPRQVTEALRDMQTQTGRSLRLAFATEDGEVETRPYQRARVNLLQGHRLARTDARRIYQHFQDQASHPFADAFFQQDEDHRVYVEVKGIAAGFAEVFDVSVPGSHSFIANGLGNHNTINFPPDATVDDVKKAYKMAWELGCKGITVYVTGSRQEVVLETKAVAEARKHGQNGSSPAVDVSQDIPTPKRRPRPSRLMGLTYRRETPLGTAYVTINQTEEKEPFEVFLNVGKAGSDVAAVSEALGRLISYILRMPSYLTPSERLQQVIYQLAGIGGGRPLGFGPQRVRSLPDAIAQVLDAYLHDQVMLQPAESASEADETAPPPGQLELPLNQIGDLCPECGQATLLNIEGCKKCINCGYSEC